MATRDDQATTEPTGRPNTESVLTVEDVRKDFGAVVALDGVSLDVRDGEIVGLIGPNGAGKTTLFNCITGVHRVTDGSIRLREKEITGLKTADIVQSGLSRTFQLARVFPDLTVRENMVANQSHVEENVVSTILSPSDQGTNERIEELIEFMSLSHLIDEPAGNLSTGQKKLLNIAGALLRDPAVVLLDEPTAGVNPRLVDDIVDSLLRLNEQGSTFFVIEHNIDVIRDISDHVYAIANGTNLVDGSPERVLGDPDVLEAYFGE